MADPYHFAIVAPTRCGKTMTLKGFLWGLLQKHEGLVRIRIVDGKDSHWPIPKSNVSYCMTSGGTQETYPLQEEIEKIYQALCTRSRVIRELQEQSIDVSVEDFPPYYLIVDEYYALMGILDKKQREGLLNKISSILNLGLEFRCYLVLIGQNYQVGDMFKNQNDRNTPTWLGLARGSNRHIIQKMANEPTLIADKEDRDRCREQLQNRLRKASESLSGPPVVFYPKGLISDFIPDLTWLDNSSFKEHEQRIDTTLFEIDIDQQELKTFLDNKKLKGVPEIPEPSSEKPQDTLEASGGLQQESSCSQDDLGDLGSSDRDLRDRLDSCWKAPFLNPQQDPKTYKALKSLHNYALKRGVPLKARDVVSAKISNCKGLSSDTIRQYFVFLQEMDLGILDGEGKEMTFEAKSYKQNFDDNL